MNDNLLYRYLRCEASPKEEVRVLDELERSPKIRRRLAAIQMSMEALALKGSGAVPQRETLRRTRRWSMGRVARWSAAAAAIIVVAAGVGLGVGAGVASGALKKVAGQRMVIEIPAGQRMSVTLPDGTQVWLNSATRLEYPAVFAIGERRVRISGEGIFDVTHDPRHPFIVETFACEAEVLGTRFNIVARADDREFSAALFEGMLKVTQNDSQDLAVVLSPDQMVTLDGGRLQRRQIPGPDEYLWPEGVLSLGNLTLEEALRKFETHYGVKVVIERDDLPETKFMGKIRISDGIDYALNLLSSAAEFTYSRSDDRDTIYIR